MSSRLPTIARQLGEIGRDFYVRGWVLGTSGNFSTVLSRKPLRLAITASSVSKGAIGPRDVLVVDAAGRRVGRSPARPSAETLLHVAIADTRRAGAILHTHSVWSTLLSLRQDAPAAAPGRGQRPRRGVGISARRRWGPVSEEGGQGLTLSGFEMLKGLEGVRTHEHQEWVPVFGNDQDMARLAGRVRRVLASSPAVHGFLLRGHGLYTWGEDLAQARRHIEIFEFLLELTGRMQAAGGARGSAPWR